MISLFRRNPQQKAAELAYRRIVDQARQPGFFRDIGVPDTVDGRFELICFHAFLFLHRLKNEPPPAPSAGRRTVSELLDEYVKHKEPTWSIQTRANNRGRLKAILSDPISRMAVARWRRPRRVDTVGAVPCDSVRPGNRSSGCARSASAGRGAGNGGETHRRRS